MSDKEETHVTAVPQSTRVDYLAKRAGLPTAIALRQTENRDAARLRWQDRVNAGNCGACGEKRNGASESRCAPCLEKHRLDTAASRGDATAANEAERLGRLAYETFQTLFRAGGLPWEELAKHGPGNSVRTGRGVQDRWVALAMAVVREARKK